MTTAPTFTTEAETCTAFDDIIAHPGLFTSNADVRGTLLQPRPGQVDKSVRIDRILLPTVQLLDLGWRHGIIGVELKRSGIKIGPAIAQAMDYTRSVFTLAAGYQVVPSMVFLFPLEKQHGPLASVLAQQRIGAAQTTRGSLLHLTSGEMNILHVANTGEVRIGAQSSGTKVGSR